MPRAEIIKGDCIEVMRTLPDNSVDSIVTDPPYGLGFMGKAWDELPPGKEWAEECLRVLKPGGHLLAFGGSRTWHRLAVAVEDAGFEIRDGIIWMYGSGFPKSMDVSKAIDKQDAAEERTRRALEFTAWMRSTGITQQQIDEALQPVVTGNHYLTDRSQPRVATADLFDLLRPHLPEVPERIEALVAQRTVESQNFKSREVVGKHDTAAPGQQWNHNYGLHADLTPKDITAPATEEAKAWEGWGTALKPGYEPCVVARKPLDKSLGRTVAANVLAHGTGALNIDGCRIGTSKPAAKNVPFEAWRQAEGREDRQQVKQTYNPNEGRWPANVILDEDAAAELDAQSGVTKSTAHLCGEQRRHDPDSPETSRPKPGTRSIRGHNDTGGASRFFYVAKAPKRERPVVVTEDGTRVAHPTVKPLTLMRHLVRLVTPPGGTVLEPFAGSGATVEACLMEGFDVIAIEREADYLPLIEKRIARVNGKGGGVKTIRGIRTHLVRSADGTEYLGVWASYDQRHRRLSLFETAEEALAFATATGRQIGLEPLLDSTGSEYVQPGRRA